MAKNKYKVVTLFGTFTRNSNRTYTHLVICNGDLPETIRTRFAGELLADKKYAARYVSTDSNEFRSYAVMFNPKYHEGKTAEQQWNEYREHYRNRIETHDARLAKALAENEAKTKYGFIGWCGRYDLAVQRKATATTHGLRNVRIIDVATGQEVQ